MPVLALFSALPLLTSIACTARLLLPFAPVLAGAPGSTAAPPVPALATISPNLDVNEPFVRSMPSPLQASIAPAAGPPVEASQSPGALLAAAAETEQRRERVERRERELETREAALEIVEGRLAAQVVQLDGLKQDLERLLGQVSAEEAARLDQLVKVYEAMKAKKAAPIFDAMDLDLLLPVIRRMRDTKIAAIVAEMSPQKARTLTAELAAVKKLPPLPTSP